MTSRELRKSPASWPDYRLFPRKVRADSVGFPVLTASAVQLSPSNHHLSTWKLFMEKSPSNIQHSPRQTLAPLSRSPALSNSHHQSPHFPQCPSLPKHTTPFPSDITIITMSTIHNPLRSTCLIVCRGHRNSSPVIVLFLSPLLRHPLPLLQHPSLRNSNIKLTLLVRSYSHSQERGEGTAI